MKDLDFSSANTLVRIREESLLSRQDMQAILDAQTNEEIRRSLERTAYAPYVTDENPVEAVLSGLKEEAYSLFEWALEISPIKELVMYFSLRRSYHNLKVLSKAYILETEAKDLYLSDLVYSVSAMEAAIQTKKSAVLPKLMLDAISDACDGSIQKNEVQIVDVIYDRYYFRHIIETAKKIGNDEILNFTKKSIDLYNISMLIRASKQKRGRTFLTSVLSSEGNIAKSRWIEMRSESLEELTESLLNTPYQKEIEQALRKNENGELLVSATKFDIVRDNSRMTHLQDAKLQVFGPMPLFAFLYSKEIERKNIRIIMKSKRDHLPKRITEERLRDSYVS